MGRASVAIALVSLSLTGCATLKESPMWPSYTKPWCYAKVKYDRYNKAYFVGVKCAF